MSAPTTHIELLRELMSWAPPIHIFGGYAEDALLHGRVTRHHEDVDVLVMRDELELRLDQAAALGFGEWHLRMADGRPLVIGSIVGQMNLEIIVFDHDEAGGVYFDMPLPDGPERLYLPEGALDAAPSRLEGVEVRAVSPLALYQIRAGVRRLFGGMRPKDRVAQAALREKFFAGVSEAVLAPRVERHDVMARPAAR